MEVKSPCTSESVSTVDQYGSDDGKPSGHVFDCAAQTSAQLRQPDWSDAQVPVRTSTCAVHWCEVVSESRRPPGSGWQRHEYEWSSTASGGSWSAPSQNLTPLSTYSIVLATSSRIQPSGLSLAAGEVSSPSHVRPSVTAMASHSAAVNGNAQAAMMALPPVVVITL